MFAMNDDLLSHITTNVCIEICSTRLPSRIKPKPNELDENRGDREKRGLIERILMYVLGVIDRFGVYLYGMAVCIEFSPTRLSD